MEKIDSSGMHRVYDRWPEIAERAYHSKVEQADFDGIDHVVFAGMGGSGAIGDLLSSILSKTGTHVTVVKGYRLPTTVDDATLIVCTSVSGNTAETLGVASAANRLGCKMICFSSGGMLERFCRKNAVLFQKVESFLNPRSSLPSYVYTVIKSLGPILPIDKSDIKESLEKMSALGRKINTDSLDASNQSLVLARQMRGVPLVYYPWGLQAAAIRFKNSIQENMKRHAMTEDVIEACHNGIVAWENASQVSPVIISGHDDHARTAERWDILREFFAQNKIRYSEVASGSGSILSKIVTLIYRLDFATIYGAVLCGIDPVPVSPIDYVKDRTEWSGLDAEW